MSHLIVKCKKCRTPVAETNATKLLTGHEDILNGENIHRPLETDCSETINSLYLMEQTLPDWMVNQIDQAQWIKGKLNCSKCQARLGSFDFVSGRKCTCGQSVLPPVHLIKNKVDFTIVEEYDSVT
ncbi:Hypothetical protein NTJ_12075 [Nesidiocoris tenuis]|uniref:E3 ubiquitin-protein ligase E3D n=1 Tax=Nesidiocoris tenuis TaxID=355587 RepID=A0ABN7B4U7_9HEMI|nr:Hypothetical protein NTJ_12075 [Nesidiocoris tenuis]